MGLDRRRRSMDRMVAVSVSSRFHHGSLHDLAWAVHDVVKETERSGPRRVADG